MKADRNKLEMAMARACMDTSDIRKVSGLPCSTLNNVVVGRSVRPATLGKVAKALKVDVEEIMQEGA